LGLQHLGIEVRATTDRLTKGMAEVAETRIADIQSGLGHVESSGGKQFSGSFHSNQAKILWDRHAHLLEERSAQIKGTAADFPSDVIETGRFRQMPSQNGDGAFDPLPPDSLVSFAKEFFLRRWKSKLDHQRQRLALEPKRLGTPPDRWRRRTAQG
jgi:hypothetical protein